MKHVASLITVFSLFSSIALPQGRPLDWPTYGGDARRTGWQRSDLRITKDNVKDFQLVLKRKLEGTETGPHSLTPPVIIGLLISYKGFKELGFVANSAGDLWSIDVDLNRQFWKKRFESGAAKGGSGLCAAVASIPALTPPVTFGGVRRRPPVPGGTNTPSPGLPPTPAGQTTERAANTGGINSPSPGLPPTPAGQTTERAANTGAARIPTPVPGPAPGPAPGSGTTQRPARLGGMGFGAPRPIYVVAGDGKVRQVNTSDGSDQFPPLDFLPANAKASTLTLHDNVIYTITRGNCGGAQDGVYAIDLAEENPRVASFPLNGADAEGLGGFAVGNDGTIYVQTGPGQSDPGSNKWSNTLLALSAKDLKLKGHFTVESGSDVKGVSGLNAPTPVVFEYKGQDHIVSAGRDGRLYLFDSQSVGGADHKSALHQTAPLSSAGGGVWGGLSTWEENGVRWVAAPIWGAANPELKIAGSNGAASNGSIVAFKVEEQGGKLALKPGWISRDLHSPVPPVITSGIVFALSTGGYTQQGTALKAKNGGRATLYALDAATGKEMYSTGDQVTAPGNLTGLTVANGRVFFTTADGTLYGFGIFLEI